MDSPALTALDLLAHELRNAAHIITSGAGLVASGEGEDAELAADVHASGLRLGTLMDRIIETARSELGGGAVDTAPISAAALVDAALVRARREHPGLQVAVNAPPASGRVAVAPQVAERVLADAAVRVAASGAPVDVRLSTGSEGVTAEFVGTGAEVPDTPDRVAQATDLLLTSLAAAAGVALSQSPGRITITLPAA